MTDREQYRTRSAYYLFTRNDLKAIEELTTLLKTQPDDLVAEACNRIAAFAAAKQGKAA